MRLLISILAIMLIVAGCIESKEETTLTPNEVFSSTEILIKTATISPKNGPPVPHSLDSSDLLKLKVNGCLACHPSISGNQVCNQDEDTCSICHKEEAQLIGKMVVLSVFTFNPYEITIHTGEIVTWINLDDVEHRVVGDQIGSFDSGRLRFGESFSTVFTESGAFRYHSELDDPGNPEMEGLIIVKRDQ